MFYYISTKISLILVACTVASDCQCLTCKNDEKDAYFYQLEPYITAKQDGTGWQGIIPDILKNLK